MVDRLKLTPAVIATVAEGCEQLAAMPDPVGEAVANAARLWLGDADLDQFGGDALRRCRARRRPTAAAR